MPFKNPLYRLMKKIQEQNCNCEAIIRKLEKALGEDTEGMPCCAKCCPCHWDKLAEYNGVALYGTWEVEA